MPKKGGVLTPMERTFAKHYGATGDATYSAAKAGYGSPQVRGSELSHKPAVAAEAQRHALAQIQNQVLPLAVARHIALLTSKKTKGPTLTKAIDLAYKYGLNAENAAKPKEAHEMSAEELALAIDALQRAAADRAHPIIEGEAREVEQDASVFD